MKFFYAMNKWWLVSAACLLFALDGQAQDPHFAQFYTANMQFNPAMTGVHSGRFRVAVNYRDQWGAVIDNPFRTIGAAFDVRHRIGKGDFIAYGVNVLRDEAGESFYTRNAGNLNLSYMKQLGGGRYRRADQYLVAGASAGVGQHRIDVNGVWFSSQYDNTNAQVNTSLPSNENINSMSDLYVDINAGLLYYAVFDDNASFYLGGALHHVNSPQISFFNNSNQTLYSKWVAQTGGEIPLNRDLSLLPGVIVMGQGPSLTSIFGTNFRYTNRDWREVAVRIGVWGELSNRFDGISIPSIIATSILEMGPLNIGLSYDVNAGLVAQPSNNRGAFEVSLVYVQPATRKLRVRCPKL
ncbi:MAG: PorP/SprF family type IX secretion system membrane protein [Bacteroidota bacterium]